LFDNTFGTYPILGAALQELLLEGQVAACSNSLTVLTDLAASSRVICFDIFPNLKKRQFRELVAVPISPNPFPQMHSICLSAHSESWRRHQLPLPNAYARR
jgi:hypothetical protein